MSPRPEWVLVWKGQPTNGTLALQMLQEHGLEVQEKTELETKLYVHPDDESTAQDLFKDWEL